MTRIFYSLGFFISVVLGPSVVFAQNQNQGADLSGKDIVFETGFHIGNLLPNHIEGMTEITGLGGARVGYRLSPLVIAEGDFEAGNGNGADYKNVNIGVRIDVPVETIVGYIGLGPDLTYYKGQGESNRMYGGGHFSGGVMSSIGGSLWFRADMKFTINPGTSMYINFGFLFRFSGSEGGGG